MKQQKNRKIEVEIVFTDGYEQRFTKAILKIYEKRMQKEERQQRMALEKIS